MLENVDNEEAEQSFQEREKQVFQNDLLFKFRPFRE